MKKITSSLEGGIFSTERRKGNTTKCIDNAIQIIFSGEICKCEDPYIYGKNTLANEDLFRRIIDRLWLEHNLSPKKELKVNYTKLTIELL